MEDYEVSEVAKILSEWNPLGDEAKYVQDLDGYKTESIDILFQIKMSKGRAGVEKSVMEVLNEAFDINLKRSECSEVATLIFRFLSNKH
ncbi:MAG: hypothetical protein ACI9KN_001456 [Gammaproteobacteria bacterium]|jgi:hypothetical protein